MYWHNSTTGLLRYSIAPSPNWHSLREKKSKTIIKHLLSVYKVGFIGRAYYNVIVTSLFVDFVNLSTLEWLHNKWDKCPRPLPSPDFLRTTLWQIQHWPWLFRCERTLTNRTDKPTLLGMQASSHAPPFLWESMGVREGHTHFGAFPGGRAETTPYCSDETPLGPDGLSLDEKTLWEEGCRTSGASSDFHRDS